MRVLKQEGSFHRASQALKVSISTVHRWFKQGWTPELPRPTNRQPSRRLALDPGLLAAVRMLLIAQPNTTLQRIKTSLVQQGFGVSLHTIRRVVRFGLGYSRKKTCRRMAGLPSADKVDRFRTIANEHITAGRLIVSLDESYVSEKLLPLYGYSPVGQKCVVRSGSGSWSQCSLLLAIASDGRSYHELHAGAYNKLSFQEFVRQLPFPVGTVILLDNVAFHRDHAAFFEKGYLPLHTPPYSPEYNPVEMAFSPFKQHVRNAWPWPAGLDDAVQTALRAVTPEHIRAFFRHWRSLLMASPQC